MEPRDAIQAQLEVLRQELIRSRAAVESPGIDAKLRGRVAARFDKELTRLEGENAKLKEKVTSGQPLKDCWGKLRKVQKYSGKVFDECLAFIQGALARKSDLDDGICALTDDLLDDLAAWSDVPWGRFTLLATSEFYRDTAEIIRIRYPEVSLWGLPLAAHEFGHYLGPKLRQSQDDGDAYPFQARLKVADETRSTSPHTQEWHHLQEHFADVFATYTLGPAYAAAFILLRMNPGDGYENTLTHPSGAQRVHGIIWTLDRMDDREAKPLGRPFREVTALLRGLWQESLRQVDQPEKLADAEASLVTQRMAELFDLLAGTTPQRLAFRWADWLRAVELATDWLRAVELATDPTPTMLPDQLTRRDVLNGAWLARLQSAHQSLHVLHDIARWASASYRRIPSRQQAAPAPRGA